MENQRRECGIVLYFNDELGFGYLMKADFDIVFFHFSDFECKSNRTCHLKQKLSFIEYCDNRFLRSIRAVEIRVEGDTIFDTSIYFEKNSMQTQEGVRGLLSSDYDVLMFFNVKFENLVFEKEIFTEKTLLFFNCCFDGLMLMMFNSFSKSVYFTNSIFKGRFSLKNSNFDRDIHMEACHFLGEGGASFRGVKCQNIYMDFGTQGPKDMVWFNEICIAKNLVIGGDFENDVQIIGNQDKTKDKIGYIGRIYIGKEYYASQRINATIIKKSVQISDVVVKGGIIVENSNIDEFNLYHVSTSSFLCTRSRIGTNMSINKSEFLNGDECINLDGTLISYRLLFIDCSFKGLVNLEGAVVDKLVSFHDIKFESNASLSLYNLITGMFRIDPITTLYAGKKSRLINPRFKILNREKQIKVFKASKNTIEIKKLVQEYTSLKKWLAETGHLIEEDEAYFNMRNRSTKNFLAKFLFNHVFGWGVRLKNILFSSLVIILSFTFIYFLIGIPLAASFVLSIQSFIASVFGQWEIYGNLTPTSSLPVVSIIETSLGVIYITAFVGAYMRKLLR